MLIAGNINSYIKQCGLRIKANMRLESGVSSIGKIAEQTASQKKQIAMSGIVSKLDFGKKLTQEELEYLRENDPQLYAKAVKIALERAQYERQLKRCKTKEEARKLHLSTTAICAQGLHDAKGTEEAAMIRWRMMAFQDAYQTYSASGAVQPPQSRPARHKPGTAARTRLDGFKRDMHGMDKNGNSAGRTAPKGSSATVSEKFTRTA